MYFYNYGPLNPSLMPNKEKFGDVDGLVSQKRVYFYSIVLQTCVLSPMTWL